MAKHYSRAPDECTGRVEHLLKCFYPELVKAGVKIDLLSVAHDDDNKPALTLHGVACLAVVSINNVKERTKGAGDATITIDEMRYLDLEDAEKDALLDHEIHHLELRLDKKTGAVKLDCRGRPRLGTKKHDYDFGFFKVIAERHGRASLEVRATTRFFLAEKQAFFDFALGESTRLALEKATS